jgi:hypothetical protein
MTIEPTNISSATQAISGQMGHEATKRRGRPRGTNYLRVDAALHDDMRRMIEESAVPTLTSAARRVANRAFGSGTLESKITRLVRSYPHR